MPNIKSAIKRVRTAKRNNERNISQKSAMRWYLRLAREAIAEGNLEEANKRVAKAYQAVDKAVKRKIIHKNAAARYKSRLAARLKAVETKSEG